MDSTENPPTDETPSAGRGWVQLLLTAVLLAGGLGLASLMFSLKKAPPQSNRGDQRTVVEVLRVALADHQVTVLTQGFFAPVTETKAASEVAGRILSVAPQFAVGGRFQEGDVLVEIDPADFSAAVAQAEGTLAEARLALVNETARSEQARRDWARLEPGKKPGPLVLREPHLAAATARLAAAEAALEKARRDLERTKIRAPYPGLIKTKRADLGDYVSPGTPLADLWRSDVFEVRLPVSVAEASFIDLAAGATAVLSDAKNEWSAPIVRTEGLVDPATRTTALIARLENPDPAPTPGLFIKARVRGRTLPGVAEIPRRALHGPDRVVIVDAENKLRFRPVTIAWQETDVVHVQTGLQSGDQVVLTALAAVAEGMPVEVLAAPAAVVPEDRPDPAEPAQARSSAGGVPGA